MPFDFKKYDAKCATLDPDALQREWEHYTRLISGAATSTAVSGLAVPFTMGVSTIGVGFAAPAIHNARKKREIIEKHLKRHGRVTQTRKRDVMAAGAISGGIGILTLGLAPVGADVITNHAIEHGMTTIAENELGVKIGTHLALDAAAVTLEEAHMHHKKEKLAWKAYAQGVKEGKNPPLPSSDLKIPGQTNMPVMVDLKTPQSVQSPPVISLIPPSDEKTFEDAATIYFPPPPYSATNPGLKVDNKILRRRSVSALPTTVQPSPGNDLPPKQDGQFVWGTTTAISAPLGAGNTICVELPAQSSSPLHRSASTIGRIGEQSQDQLPSGSPTTPTITSQEAQNNPPPHLTPHQSFSGYQHVRPQLQQRKAESSPFLDSYPSSKMQQQTQVTYGMTQVPPSPGPLQIPISPALSHRRSVSAFSTISTQTTGSSQLSSPTSTWSQFNTPATTSSQLSTPTTASSYFNTPATTSSEFSTPTTTSSYFNTPTTTSSQLSTPTTTSSDFKTPTTTSSQLNAWVTAASQLNAPTTTSNQLNTSTTVSSSINTSVTPLSSNAAPSFASPQFPHFYQPQENQYLKQTYAQTSIPPYDPANPGNFSNQAHVQNSIPAYDPRNPGNQPNQTHVQNSVPGYDPKNPGNLPNQSHVQNAVPAYNPRHSGIFANQAQIQNSIAPNDPRTLGNLPDQTQIQTPIPPYDPRNHGNFPNQNSNVPVSPQHYNPHTQHQPNGPPTPSTPSLYRPESHDATMPVAELDAGMASLTVKPVYNAPPPPPASAPASVPAPAPVPARKLAPPPSVRRKAIPSPQSYTTPLPIPIVQEMVYYPPPPS